MESSLILKELSKPFPMDEIKIRVGSVSKKNKKNGTALAYVDARMVYRRLDEVVGTNNWMTKISETPRGRVICELSVRMDGEWITKTDGAGDTAVEGEKGGISDAIKRAAVQFGIGQYLYDLPTVWVELDDYKRITDRGLEKAKKAMFGSVATTPKPNPKPTVKTLLSLKNSNDELRGISEEAFLTMVKQTQFGESIYKKANLQKKWGLGLKLSASSYDAISNQLGL